MRLAAYTDYGLRVLMRLAGTPDEAISTGQIAEEFAISRHHLAKVVRDLGHGGFVLSQRGRAGGLMLARPAQTITLGEVVRHLEQRFAVADCFREDGGDCVLKPRCGLRPQLSAAREAFISELDRTTIAECAWSGDGPDRGDAPRDETECHPALAENDAIAHGSILPMAQIDAKTSYIEDES